MRFIGGISKVWVDLISAGKWLKMDEHLQGNPQDPTEAEVDNSPKKKKKGAIVCMCVVCHTLTKHAHLSLCKRVLSPA